MIIFFHLMTYTYDAAKLNHSVYKDSGVILKLSVEG